MEISIECNLFSQLNCNRTKRTRKVPLYQGKKEEMGRNEIP